MLFSCTILKFMLLALGFSGVLCQNTAVKAKGFFWHITDTHVDQNYSRTGNPHKMCHDDGKLSSDAGLYGNFLCDAPLYLVDVTVKSMKDIQPSPDFIIWTGDNLPHTSRLHFNPDWKVTFESIKNITGLLTSAFPGIPILPSIGNHDTFPPNIIAANNDSRSIYQGYLEEGGWKDLLLTDHAKSTFTQGGFFSLSIKPGLRIISLNTILWYISNKVTSDLADPGNQLKWLEDCLKNCSKMSDKVYIIGHVAPGFYNRVIPGEKSMPTYHPQYSKAYLNILLNYSQTIIGQFYGHVHMDMFQIFQYNTGTFKGSSLLAPSVTPWYGIDAYNVGIPVNPAVRLMHYSKNDSSLLDYDEFFLNLTRANSNANTTKVPNNPYEKLYTFTDAYGVSDLSTESLVKVYELLKNNVTVFDSFFKFLTSGKEFVECDNDCTVAQLCSMSSLISDEYDPCMKSIVKTGGASRTVILVVGLVLGFLVILVVGFFMYKKYCQNRMRYFSDFPYIE